MELVLPINRLFLVVVLDLVLDWVVWIRVLGRSGPGPQCAVKKPSGLPMNRASQIRRTNHEIRRNDEIRMTKPATAQLRGFGHSGFGFLSSFVIPHSTTCANQVHGPNA